MSYFVFDLKKVKTKDEFNKVVLGHNLRRRHTSQNQNIDFSKSSRNIVLKDFDGTIDNYLEKCNKAARENGGRALKKNSSFAFNLVIDCSQMDGWPEKKYIQYLKDSYEFIKKHFSGQDILAASIHVDETKPHLHVTVSYFNSDIGRWNQRNLAKQKKTDLNTLLKRFERDVAAKYGLKRGDGATTRKKLLKALKSQGLIKNVPVKTGTFSSDEKKFIAPGALKFFVNSPAALKADNIQLKNKLAELNTKISVLNEKIQELEYSLLKEKEKSGKLFKENYDLKRENKKMKEHLKVFVKKYEKEAASPQKDLTRKKEKAKPGIKYKQVGDD